MPNNNRPGHLVNIVCVVSLLLNIALPIAPVSAATPSPTSTPPIESQFQGATQSMVAGPLGLDVSIYDLSLRATRTDFFIPGCAVPLQATFIFEPGFGDSPFGYGWRFVYGAGYTVQGDGSLLIGPVNGYTAQYTPGDGRLSRPQPGRYELHLDNGDIYYFDDPAHQQVTKIEARGGGFITLAYDAAGQLTRVTDKYGRSLDFTYANSKLTAITDANAAPARATSYAYDADGNLASVTDPMGSVTRYSYGSSHQMRRVTDPTGNWASLTYIRELNIPTDFPDGVAQITTPLGAISFDRQNVLEPPPSVPFPRQPAFDDGQTAVSQRQIIAKFATVTDMIGGQKRTTRYEFSVWTDQLIKITDPEGNTTEFKRDNQGNLTQLVDENGAVTSYVYNSAGQLLQVTDPLARVTKYSYDANGQVASITDPSNQTTTFTYDSRGNLTGVTDPMGHTTRASFDANGKLLTVTNPLSNTLSYSYDAFGFPTSVRDAAGVTTTFSYNARGDLLQTTNGLGGITRYGRDALGRTITATNPAGETTRLAYDANGNVTQSFDPAGRVVNYSYDASGRPTAVSDALGNVNYTYDEAGNITAISDGMGHQDSFIYDLNGRLTSRTDGLNRTTAFAYDPAGNLIRRTDPLTQTTSYTYDAANQLTGVAYPDGSSVSRSYDANGNLLQEANGVVTVSYSYDAKNRLTSATADGKTISYTYDAGGRRASMTDPDGNKTTYAYDGAGRLLAVNDPLAGTTGYSYNAAGKLARLDRGNGVYSLYVYDAANRLQAITHHAANGSVLDSFTYTYDAAGNRTSVASAQNGTTTFAYDGRYQLTAVTYPDGTSTTYTYDLAGNRLTENGAAYTYDAAAQMLTAGSSSFSWDARGNQIGETGSGVNTAFSYDHENRLTGGSFTDSTQVNYDYYPDGRLYSRTDRAGQTTRFYYDGPNLLLETDTGGSTQTRYTNGLHLDAWLAMQTGGQNYAYLHDGLNSITGLTDSSGALAASYQYDAYGNVRAQTGSVSNPFLFTGRYWDDDIDLYQYRARWYDPDNGRFLSRDPLGPINIRQPYAYVNNNPTTNVDPLGLDTWKCDSGKVSVGFLIGYERTNLRCTNQRTGETCSLLQKCWKIGALAGASLGGCGGRVFDGPATGDGFNSSGLENGWSVTAGIGGGVGVGGEVSGNTSSQGPGSELNLCGGVGSFGLEFELGGQHCSTTVLSCTRPKEPNPPPKKPPTGPGSDHADDNFSAAGRTLPISSLQSPISNYATQNPTPSLSLVGQPRVGIFWHGYAEEAQALLASWGWESAPVDIDFSPTALDLPVLFIPSGGLNGLDSAPSVRARLEAFAAKGGVIIALAQQHGYEFTSLPGGQLNGYGWAEDNSCFDASLYVSEYQPFLSGFSQSTLTAGVDGFFTDLPDAAQILLNRTRDGQPGLTLYPYQSGWVAAASVYDDWGSSNHQPPADSARLLRDLLSWGVDADGPLPEFSPGMTATVPITVVNAGLLDTARVRFQVIDPDGQAVMTQTLDLPLQPGDASLQTIQVPNLPADLGIWWTQYTLLDASDNVLQPAVWHGRFAVSDPHPATGPNKDMSLSITAPTEDFVPGPATFTFHVRNFTNSSQPATVYYGLPHHTWETGDPAYGDFYNLSQSLTVPPQSEITFTHTANILTNDRLFARMTGAGFAQDAWFQVRVTPPAVYLEAQMGGGAFGRGRAAQGVVTLRNYQGAAYQVTLNMQAQDGRSGLLYQGQQTTLLQSTAVVTTPITFTIPITAQLGTAVFAVTAQDADGNNLNVARANFLIPDSPLTFNTTLPNTFTPGASAHVTVTVANNGFLDVNTAVLTTTLTAPDGSVQTLPAQPFTLAAGLTQTLTIPFTVPQAQFGTYTFAFKSVDEYGSHDWTAVERNEPVMATTVGQTAYAAGDQVQFKVNVQNSGHWSQNVDWNVLVGAPISAAITIPLALDPGEPASMTVDIPLPTNVPAGSYQFTSTLIPPVGQTISNTASIMVPDADLSISLANRTPDAGTAVNLTLTNSGGVDTAAGYRAWLRDGGGVTVQTITGTIANVAHSGGGGSFAFSIPAAAVSGSYVLGGVITNTQAGVVRPFTFLVTVNGIEAAITAHTQPIINPLGQPITATTAVTNSGGLAISGAAVHLAVDAPPDWTWFTHRPGQHGPAGSTSGIVTDTAGFKWMVTHRAINAFDDGGTPFDTSDDHWQVFDALNGLPYSYAYNVFVDAAGYKWINSEGPSGRALSVLDDGGTPLDVSDDQWLHYTTADGFQGGILGMAEDAAGNIWMGGGYGVAVLDPGADPMDKSDDGGWVSFTTTDGLAHNRVNAVTIDAAGYKWFATDNGASVLDDGGDPFDGAGDTWQSFYVGSGLPDNRVIAVEIDANGRKWFAGGGISFAYDVIIGVLDTGASPVDGTGDTYRTFAPPTSSLYGIVLGFSLDENGRAWFALPSNKFGILDTGADPFDGTGDTWGSVTSYPYPAALPMISAGGNSKWLLSGYGLMLFDHGGTPFNDTDDIWQLFSVDAGIANYNINVIAAGEAGMTWFAGGNQVYGPRVLDPMGTPNDPSDDRWMSFNQSDGLPYDNVTAMITDQAGAVWVSVFGGPAVLDHNGTPFDKSDDVWQAFGESDIGLASVADMVVDNANRKWFVGWDNSNTNFLSLLDDSGTPITKTDDLTMTFTITGLATNSAKAIAIDQSGVKWMVNYAEAIALDDGGTPFDKNDDVWQTFYLYAANHSLKDVAVDGQNNIWFAFEGNSGGVGVLDYNGTLTNTADDTWRYFYNFNGLVDNWVLGVAVDGRGDKWFATISGLSRLDDGGDPFDGANDTWESFTTEVGMGIDPSPQVDVVAVGGDGNVWAGTFDNGASVAVWQGTAVWSAQQPIATLPPAGNSRVITNVNGLTSPGRYVLRGSLVNALGQTAVSDQTPFYIVTGQTALMLDASPNPARPGAAITVTGALVNNGAAPVTNQTVWVYQDGAFVGSEGPFDVPANSSHSFTFNTIAPTSGDSSAFTAVASGLTTDMSVTVAQPNLTASTAAPAVVGSDPFTVTISLTNTGVIAGQVQLSVNGYQWPVSVPPGETVVAQASAQVCSDGTIPVNISGDLTQTLSLPVTFGEGVTAVFTPQSIYAPGPLSIPHTFTNTGQLDIAFTTTLTISNSQFTIDNSQFSSFLIAAESNSGSSLFDLPAADYTLSYAVQSGNCALAAGQQNFTVAPLYSTAVTATIGAPAPMRPITATLTNNGSAGFLGEAQLTTDFGYQAAQAISLPVGGSQVVTFTADVSPAAAGVHTATVTAVTGDGVSTGQTAVPFTVLGPVLSVTAWPNQTSLPVSQTITLTFGVSNQGDQDGPADFSFSLGDIETEEQVRLVPYGQTEPFDVTFFVPPGLEAKDYVATVDLNGVQTDLLFTIQGISLTVTAVSDQPAYREGEAAQLQLTIANNLPTTEPGLYALVSMDGVTQTRPFTLTTTPSVLTFPLTATFGNGGLVFYGIYYQATQRGLHLNTFRLPQQQETVTVLLDEQVYVPGGSVAATVVTTVTGQLEVSAPGYSATLTLPGGTSRRPLAAAAANFAFTLPTAMQRGSYAVTYRLTGCNCDDEGRVYQAVFDVAGPQVRVTEARLDNSSYWPGDGVNLRLTTASDQPVSGALSSWLVYPDGRTGPIASQSATLLPQPNNILTATGTITGTQAGLYFLHYALADAADPGVVYAAGVEAFDVGFAALLDVFTDREAYETSSEPVTAVLQIHATQPAAGQLVLSLDGAAPQIQPLTLAAGRQFITATLNAPVLTGQRVLTATLIVGGLSGTEQVTFDYGIQLADLIPGLPWVEPGGVVTRTVGAWVVNHGDSAATATTARFYDGDPDGGGVLIDTAVVPGLAAGAQAMVSVSWDIQGQGGDHNLFVQVDPVTEFDVGNNVAGTAVSLPTFAANLTINPTSLTTGELLTVNSQVMNLQGAVSLPVTVTVEILAPTGTAVHAQTWAIVLNGGEVRQLAAVWNSPPAASGGVYQAIMTIRDENDYLTERHKLIVVNPRAGYDVYLPIIFSN